MADDGESDAPLVPKPEPKQPFVETKKSFTKRPFWKQVVSKIRVNERVHSIKS